MAGQVASSSLLGDNVSVDIAPEGVGTTGMPPVEISASQDMTAESASTSRPHGTSPTHGTGPPHDTPEVEISEDTLKLWQFALSKENCKAAWDLLNKYPRLARQGWKEHPSTTAEGLRTALLVGARRGYPELVKKMLKLGKEDDLMQGEDSPLTVRGMWHLLAAKDPHYELDALDMAIFHGNREIVFELANASFACKLSNPYEIQKRIDTWQEDRIPNQVAMKERIKLITVTVMTNADVEDAQWLHKKYEEDYNFNFLPWEEYLFSFACGKIASSSNAVSIVRDQIFQKVLNDTDFIVEISDHDSRSFQLPTFYSLLSESDHGLYVDYHNKCLPTGITNISTSQISVAWTVFKDVLYNGVYSAHESKTRNGLLDFLLQLKDGLGRTAVHVAVEAGEGSFFLTHVVDKNWANGLLDGVGRTALHWAAALDCKEFLSEYLKNGDRMSTTLDLNKTFDVDVPFLKLESEWLHRRYGPVLTGPRGNRNRGQNNVSPLRLAIIHNHAHCVDAILNDSGKNGRPVCIWDFYWDGLFMQKVNILSSGKVPKSYVYRTFTQFSKEFDMGPLELAIIVRSAPIVDLLLKDGRVDGQQPSVMRVFQFFSKFTSYISFYCLHSVAIQPLIRMEFTGLKDSCTYRFDGFYQFWCWFWFLLVELFVMLPLSIILSAPIWALLILECVVLLPLYIILGLFVVTLQIVLALLVTFRLRVEFKLKFYPALHIAAGLGNFNWVKTLLDRGHESCHPFHKDNCGNTALHHVMLGMNDDYYGHQDFKLETQFLENVTLEQFVKARKREEMGDLSQRDTSKAEMGDLSQRDTSKAFVDRQGCIEFLLQGGFDPWPLNKDNQSPHPGDTAPSEFLSWWYDKLTKETIATQGTLNAAANAISVTAALVATASYVGPLQPPLTYREYPSNSKIMEIHMEDPLVRIFITSNTLSFFLAVAAIMMAMIPSIPIPHQSARIELQRTRRIVNIAVGFLFPSIVSILVAFATTSIAVIPKDQRAWKYGGLSMTSSAIGGFFCLCVIILFSLRILVVLDIVPFIRNFYDSLGV